MSSNRLSNDEGEGGLYTESPTLLVTPEEAMRLCGFDESDWYKLLRAGLIPAPVRIGKVLRWRRRELELWVEAACPPWEKCEQLNAQRSQSVEEHTHRKESILSGMRPGDFYVDDVFL